MSRSRKHIPGVKDNAPWEQRLAHRKLRHQCSVPDHGAYKKFYDQWNLCDYKHLIFTTYQYCRETYKEWIK